MKITKPSVGFICDANVIYKVNYYVTSQSPVVFRIVADNVWTDGPE